MANYAHPESLVTTDWVAQHQNDPKVRIVEVDVDTKSYDESHIPNAIAWAWNTQLSDTLKRDILSKEQFEELMAEVSAIAGVVGRTVSTGSTAPDWETARTASNPTDRQAGPPASRPTVRSSP